MRDIAYIEYSQAGLPVSAVDIRSSKSRIVLILAWPCLHSHIVDVYPTPISRLPVYLGLTHLENNRAISRAVEIQMCDRDPSTGISLSNVTGIIVWICDEYVPLVVYNVRIQIMRSTRVIGVIPSVNEYRVSLVRDFDQSDGNLGGIFPATHIGIGSAGIH